MALLYLIWHLQVHKQKTERYHLTGYSLVPPVSCMCNYLPTVKTDNYNNTVNGQANCVYQSGAWVLCPAPAAHYTMSDSTMGKESDETALIIVRERDGVRVQSKQSCS